MKIKKKYFSYEYLLLGGILFFLYIKLIFSYLSVENGWWIRHLPLNVEAFNPFHLPANFSGKLEYVILPLMLVYLTYNNKFVGKFKLTLFIGFLLLSLNLCTSLYTGTSIINSINHTIKLLSPILFFICLIVFSKKQDNNLKKILFSTIKLCLFLAIFALMFFNISNNRNENQWPIYFSGIHTHSYVLTSIFIGLSYYIFKEKKTSSLLLFLATTFLILFFGYGVRTVLIIYLIYIITLLYVKSNFFKYLWVQILVITPAILLVGLFIIQSLDINKFSSGRLDMYGEKLEILKNYNIPEYLFGRGAGSDFIKTESWWYSEKGSHSDFITFTIENGIPYLFLFIFLMVTIIPYYKRVNLIYLSLLFGYLFSSLISNGIVVRPIAGYVIFMVLAYIYMDIIKSNTSINE